MSLSLEPEKMPFDEEIILDATLWKLTSNYKWKPMRLMLTPTRLAMTNLNAAADKNDFFLKDSIPLEEVVSVNWRKTLPERLGSISHLKLDGFASFF